MARLKTLNTFKTNSCDETKKIAFEFAKSIKPLDMILLVGDIGSGKTTFLKGVLNSFGSKKNVISSSFSLMSFYKAKKMNLVHFDFYRIDGNVDYYEIIEYLRGKNVIAIEWPYDITNYFIFKPYIISIDIVSENKRRIKIKKYE